ncbi:hypothetical protein PCANC_22810 [Puccinia coronata f. sp. avenae]|uniref:Uncharacterized protein n=1 Tax=Puccinia coronata f. sp. avenae TaxID=200324 RepID=A0A2N5UCS4_9BASI|nr:hypothetical protein PCANC_22810 [Puccinia coronata f. sp. avenae]
MASGGTLGNGSTQQAAALQQELSPITWELVELLGFWEQTMSCLLIKLMAANMNPAFRYFVDMYHHPINPFFYQSRFLDFEQQIIWMLTISGFPDLQAIYFEIVAALKISPEISIQCPDISWLADKLKQVCSLRFCFLS